MTISAQLGDITTIACDAIVNAANSSLLGGGGVDGAIHRAAGARLLDACRTLGGCPTGEARLTEGYNLRARWVVHTVGPVWQGGEAGEAQLLTSCYRASLLTVLEAGARSIAFPAISTGVYGYPVDKACTTAVEAVRAALGDLLGVARPDVLFACFDQETLDCYNAQLQPSPTPSSRAR
tara:strand:+ start:3102 stop:3638 length:537 start_codon:yes stop_codon:yes gene_type:complete